MDYREEYFKSPSTKSLECNSDFTQLSIKATIDFMEMKWGFLLITYLAHFNGTVGVHFQLFLLFLNKPSRKNLTQLKMALPLVRKKSRTNLVSMIPKYQNRKIRPLKGLNLTCLWKKQLNAKSTICVPKNSCIKIIQEKILSAACALCPNFPMKF